MEPDKIKVEHCRVCLSKELLDTKVQKTFYLMNLEQTISYNYLICKDCQFIFNREYVGDDFLELYYKSSPMLRRVEATEFEIDQNKRQSEFLSRNLNLKEKTVLEIGAHAGAFLVHLHNEYNCDAYFNEMSEEANKVLASQDGLTDYCLTHEKKMDLIVLRHVLEHIFDLDKFITYLRSIITDDGYLFVEVPDWSWLDNQTDPLIFEHLNQFSTHNLILLMKRLGWQCESIEKSIHQDDPATPNRVQRLLFKPSKVPALFENKIVECFQGFYKNTYGKSNEAINTLLSNINPDKKIALYPASHLTFSALNESKLSQANIEGIFDIDPKKHGKVIGSIEVYPAEKLLDISPDLILLFTMGYEREIRDSFADMGVTAEVISISQLIE
jgi:hypothetical protein